MKPGNSGGGKAPDFWYAFEEGTARFSYEAVFGELGVYRLALDCKAVRR